MKKKIFLLFLMAFSFIPFAKVSAGITDSNVVRKTTTNYHTIVDGNLSITGTDTYSKDYKMGEKDDQGKYARADHIDGNYDDPVIQNVVSNYKNDMNAIAASYHTTISTSAEGIVDYYYDAHDEITNYEYDNCPAEGYEGQNCLVINTILDKYQVYRVTGKAITKNIKTVNINLEGPFVGDDVTLTPIQGVCLNAGGCYEVSVKPDVSTTDAHIELDALWVTSVTQFVDDIGVNYFSGSISRDQKYKALIFVKATDGYRLEDNVVIKVNGADPDSIMDFMADNGEVPVVTEIESQARKVEYKLDDERGNQIIFTDDEGIVYVFNSTDILNITDEEKAEIASQMGKTVEEITEMGNKTIEAALEAAKGKGTLIGLYDFSVYDGHNFKEEASGGFKIRIKMTDEMKKYDTFSIGFMKDDGTLDTLIILTRKGDYLEGTLPHLSTYAIIGNKVEINETSNPPTGDNILIYAILLGISLIGLYAKKKIEKKIQ